LIKIKVEFLSVGFVELGKFYPPIIFKNRSVSLDPGTASRLLMSVPSGIELKNAEVTDKLAWKAILAECALSTLLIGGCAKFDEFSAPKPTARVDSSAGDSSSDVSVQKVDLRGLQFQRNGAIRPDSKPVVDAAAEFLKNVPGATVYVDAYCDPTGGKRVNQKVSKERAEAVAEYLEHHGIASDRLVPRGFGVSDFVASNKTPAGREQNRRIELVVVRKSAPVIFARRSSPSYEELSRSR
jgi:hypothetical protein